MKILAVDVGTGTQDILLFDTHFDIENTYKMVLPAPTMIVRRKLQKATRDGRAVLLSGVTMGGGPNHWAVEAHLRSGLPVYATPDAARTFNDDLSHVQNMGVRIVSEDEAARLQPEVERIALCDFDLGSIRSALNTFGVSLEDLSAVAVAVFDHGAAPPDISDRQFRFDYLNERLLSVNRSRLSAFAFLRKDIPPVMTRLQAVASSAGDLEAPLVVMDTAPAAVLGAGFDPQVALLEEKIIANVGNFHTLAFRFGSTGVEGVFEHHTGLLNKADLEALLNALADGTLEHEDVFESHGHGALIYNKVPVDIQGRPGSLVVTGPRRSMLAQSYLRPYFAVPFGDMMVAGCFGLLAATADLLPELREPIIYAMSHPGGISRPPWEE